MKKITLYFLLLLPLLFFSCKESLDDVTPEPEIEFFDPFLGDWKLESFTYNDVDYAICSSKLDDIGAPINARFMEFEFSWDDVNKWYTQKGRIICENKTGSPLPIRIESEKYILVHSSYRTYNNPTEYIMKYEILNYNFNSSPHRLTLKLVEAPSDLWVIGAEYHLTK